MLDFISQKNTMVSKRGFGNSHPQQCIMVCFIFNFSFCFCFPKIDFTYNLGLSHIQLKCIKNIHEIKLLIGLRDFFSRITLKYLVNHVVVLRNIWNVNRCAFYITLKIFKKSQFLKLSSFFWIWIHNFQTYYLFFYMNHTSDDFP